MYEMNIAAVGVGTASEQAVVILTDDKKQRALPIFVGTTEATAISLAAQNQEHGRPLTYEVACDITQQLGFKIDHLEINDIRDGAYVGRLCLLRGDSADDETEIFDARIIDCRPSDGIAMALKAGAPILLSPELYDTATVSLASLIMGKDELEFQKFLDEVKASDFAQFANQIQADHGEELDLDSEDEVK
jgi:bifunctional DNase/RNase